MNAPNVDTQQRIHAVLEWLNQRIVGQERLTERLLLALLTGGHLLVEGAPGLAKTRSIRELARAIAADFQRIQFTPDLLPSDVTGSEIYRPETGEFEFQAGPLFNSVILADEVNRAPAKVQSALLEAMAEQQVSVGKVTYRLPELFLVMATQNPIEQEGTYPLPEAQLDRFLLHVVVDYPDAQSEREILAIARSEFQHEDVAPTVELDPADVFEARRAVADLYMAPAVEEYLVQLVVATRQLDELAFGASPRASIALDQCAKAHAWLNGVDYVSPADIQNVAHDVLRHRLIPSFEANVVGFSMDRLIDDLLEAVPVP